MFGDFNVITNVRIMITVNEVDDGDDDDWDCGSEVRKLLSMCTGGRYAVLAPSTIPSWPALTLSLLLLLPLGAHAPVYNPLLFIAVPMPLCAMPI